jgi:integrative and conjugative element protein (TIGR02256 family)
MTARGRRNRSSRERSLFQTPVPDESRSQTTAPEAAAAPPCRRVVVCSDASVFAQKSSEEHVPNESGGIAIGRVRGEVIVVTHLTGPGPRAVHLPDRFVRDGEYAQAMLEAAVEETDGRDNYLGEWHSHPFPEGPSAQDWESMRRISQNPNYSSPHPLLFLCRRLRRGWRLEAYRWDGMRLGRLSLSIESGALSENPK